MTVHYNPEGFPNDVTDDDDHSLEIVSVGEGCTPGFWQGGFGSQEGNSPERPAVDRQRWGRDEPLREHCDLLIDWALWVDSGNATVDNMTMIQVVGSGGTKSWPRKAARERA